MVIHDAEFFHAQGDMNNEMDTLSSVSLVYDSLIRGSGNIKSSTPGVNVKLGLPGLSSHRMENSALLKDTIHSLAVVHEG